MVFTVPPFEGEQKTANLIVKYVPEGLSSIYYASRTDYPDLVPSLLEVLYTVHCTRYPVPCTLYPVP